MAHVAHVAEEQFEEHEHPAAVHNHGHYHVTHNFREMTGGFEHLSSYHEHEHDHAAVNHSHYPHENFDREHEGEAHVHDHGETVKPARAASESSTAKKPAAKKAPAKKTE
jgi:hypothetical protein